MIKWNTIVCIITIILLGSNMALAQIENMPQLGVCATLDKSPLVKKHGFQFIQPTVSEALQPFKPSDEFNECLVKNAEVNVSVVNVFIPGSIKTTGPDVDEDAILHYAKTVYERAEKLKIETIVFGSGASRHIPEGFDRESAFMQFVHISKKLAELAAQYNVVIALESQNKEECNFLNTIKECIQVAEAVDHPNFRITVDIYHMMRENESPNVILEGGKYIHHCDIGEKETRSAPGVSGDDFVPYFKAFQQIGYKGKIALECRFNNLETELPLALKTIGEQWLAASTLH